MHQTVGTRGSRVRGFRLGRQSGTGGPPVPTIGIRDPIEHVADKVLQKINRSRTVKTATLTPAGQTPISSTDPSGNANPGHPSTLRKTAIEGFRGEVSFRVGFHPC